ncbi:MAG: 5-formyltetrahydrofolate cyclo-ligase, partial [Haloplanus sp.]
MNKQALRERVWDDLEASGEARFPFPPHGRIPNFAGASEAADRLATTDEWRGADTIKANPDAPQLPVRRAALRAGKTVCVAVPRLRDERAFRRLNPTAIDDYDAATTVSGIDEYGVPVG